MFTQWLSFPAVFTSICNRVYLKSPLIAQSAWPVLCSGHGPLRVTSEQLCAVLELQGQADAVSHSRAVKAECPVAGGGLLSTFGLSLFYKVAFGSCSNFEITH